MAPLPNVEGYDHKYVGMEDQQFYAFISQSEISDSLTLTPFFRQGGISIRENKDLAEHELAEAKVYADRVTPVMVGQYGGYVRRQDEVAPDLRPYDVMWAIGSDWFVLTSGASDVDVAVDAARSAICD